MITANHQYDVLVQADSFINAGITNNKYSFSFGVGDPMKFTNDDGSISATVYNPVSEGASNVESSELTNEQITQMQKLLRKNQWAFRLCNILLNNIMGEPESYTGMAAITMRRGLIGQQGFRGLNPELAFASNESQRYSLASSDTPISDEPLYDDLKDAEGVSWSVGHIAQDGSYEEIPVSFDGDTLSFTTNKGLSPFFLVATMKEETTPVESYTITATAGDHGSISPIGSVSLTKGSNQEFTFTPDSGYEVDSVTVDGSAVSTDGKSYTISDVQANHTIHVTFKTTGTASSGTDSTGTGSTGSNSTSTSSTSPKTGDGNHLFLYIVIFIAAAAIITGGVLYRRKHRR